MLAARAQDGVVLHRDNGVSMLGTIIVILSTALLSSAITLFCAWLWLRRAMALHLRDLHEDIGRTVEVRTRRAVAEALADINTGDVLREATWKAARSGSDFLSDGLQAILGKRRRVESESRE